MKTRIIHTKLWMDASLRKMSPEAHRFFLYLLTCSYINLIGVFELPEDIISFEYRVDQKTIRKLKDELTAAGRVFFLDDWVVVAKATKHNKYMNSPLTSKAFYKEYEELPIVVKKFLDTTIDTTIYTDRNKKQEIINNKTEIRNKKEETINNIDDVKNGIKEMLKDKTL